MTMKSVAGASSSSSTSAATRVKRYACCAALLVAVFFVVSMSSGNNNKNGDSSFRSGQASRNETLQAGVQHEVNIIETTPTEGTKTSYDKEPPLLDLDAAVETAERDFAQAEQEELGKEQRAMLDPALAQMNKWMRMQLQNLLGEDDNFDADEIDELGNKCEIQLNNVVVSELKSKADALKEEETQEMEVAADLDESEAPQKNEMAVDLQQEEQRLKNDLKTGIDKLTEDLVKEIKSRAAAVLTDVLEVALKAKFGSSYLVNFDENFNVLSYQRKPSSTTTNPTGSTRSKSSGSHHSSSGGGHHSSSGHHSSGGSSSRHHHSSSGHSSSTRTSHHSSHGHGHA